MCGILAIVSKKGNPLDREKCLRSKEELLKRGPDYSYSNFYSNDRVFLAQTILSITGSPGGELETFHLTDDQKIDVIFNGEIYNHQELAHQFLSGHTFKTKTDTEVLTKLHSVLPAEKIIENLDGMFSFMSYNTQEEKLYVSRDLIGEKILYYLDTSDFIIVSSEVKPILSYVPRKINVSSLREYFFTRHYLTLDETPFEGVRLFPSGESRVIDLNKGGGAFEIANKVSLKDLVSEEKVFENRKKSLDQLTDEFEEVFDNCCKSMIPHGVKYSSVFSGGIDSSLCSYYFAKYKEPYEFLTLVFPGKDIISEEITRFEKFLPKEITKIEVSINSFSEAFDACYRYNCSPIATHSFISQYLLSQRVHESGAKVIIGGDGADELFGGYELYKNVFHNDYQKMPTMNPSPYSGYVPLGIEFQDWSSKDLQERLKNKWEELSSAYHFEKNLKERVFQTMLLSDTSIELESVGIRSSDIMSMANSVEGRSPFMRKGILEFGVNLPSQFKIDPMRSDLLSTKKVVKNLFKRIFGEELLYPKQGFSGYPNEAASIHLQGRYQLFNEILAPVDRVSSFSSEQRALEWKVMNVEYFLQMYQSFLK